MKKQGSIGGFVGVWLLGALCVVTAAWGQGATIRGLQCRDGASSCPIPQSVVNAAGQLRFQAGALDPASAEKLEKLAAAIKSLPAGTRVQLVVSADHGRSRTAAAQQSALRAKSLAAGLQAQGVASTQYSITTR